MPNSEEDDFGDRVAAACYEHYASRLGKAGKPDGDTSKWTLLAAILLHTDKGGGDMARPQNLRIVSMATGSKCIGKSKMCPKGSILNDSHAEVLARRAFIRYLHHQIRLAITNSLSEILEKSSEAGEELKFRLKSDTRFHLFSSHVPCGDAAIFPRRRSSRSMSDACPPLKRRRMMRTTDSIECDHDQDDDVYRTGAKCVSGGFQDPLKEGAGYHVLGALRTKPGRGDPTLSMSCSDKIAKWNILGLQGTLLMRFLVQPIYLTSIVIGRCSYSEVALRRAVIDRLAPITELPSGYAKNEPRLVQSGLEFADAKSAEDDVIDGSSSTAAGATQYKALPVPTSVVWSDVPEHGHEVTVDGYKQGTTKKNRGTPQSRSAVSKYELFASYHSLLKQADTGACKVTTANDPLTYEQCKNNSSAAAHSAAKRVFLEVFNNWTTKPKELVQFTLGCECVATK